MYWYMNTHVLVTLTCLHQKKYFMWYNEMLQKWVTTFQIQTKTFKKLKWWKMFKSHVSTLFEYHESIFKAWFLWVFRNLFPQLFKGVLRSQWLITQFFVTWDLEALCSISDCHSRKYQCEFAMLLLSTLELNQSSVEEDKAWGSVHHFLVYLKQEEQEGSRGIFRLSILSLVAAWA